MHVDCKTVRISAYSSTRDPRAVKRKVWNEAENRERDWGETLASHALRKPDGHVRLVRFALKTLTPRFTDFFTNFEKKTDCFAVCHARIPLFSSRL